MTVAKPLAHPLGKVGTAERVRVIVGVTEDVLEGVGVTDGDGGAVKASVKFTLAVFDGAITT
jgi:hypothetical protein